MPEREKTRTQPEKPMETQQFDQPVAVISRRASERLRAGHVWVYQSDIETIQGDAAPGLLPVVDRRGMLQGTALYSPSSQITLRLVSGDLLDEAQWLDLLRRRIRSAVELRRTLLSAETNACRLIFSEADALPGLVADKYGDLIILQVLTKAFDTNAIRTLVAEELRAALDPASIIERTDPRIREIEQISASASAPLFARNPEHPLTQTEFLLNGLHFHYDANAGQKTGAFLDQRQNYAAAASYAKGEALDICTYQGGFALHLAKSCGRVTGVDVSRAALEVAEKNLAANEQALRSSQVDWIEADAFELLRDWSASGNTFDTIVLDPPAFAKSKRAAEGALRGYKELNLRAFKMLRPGGVLVTCSCSHHISPADFQAIVASAAADAGRRVRLIERRGAAEDHPVILTIPETEYLKCLICSVE